MKTLIYIILPLLGLLMFVGLWLGLYRVLEEVIIVDSFRSLVSAFASLITVGISFASNSDNFQRLLK